MVMVYCLMLLGALMLGKGGDNYGKYGTQTRIQSSAREKIKKNALATLYINTYVFNAFLTTRD
jgi:hypothetical protein